MKKLWLWYLLLTKRLLKKPSFLAVLLLAPLLAISLTLLAKEESAYCQNRGIYRKI